MRLRQRASCTNSICAPSRASILTGTYSHVNGVTTLSTAFDGRQPTFVEAPAGRRLPDGDLRQVAPRRARAARPGLRLLERSSPARATYYDPRLIDADGRATRTGLRDRHHHRPRARLARQPRPGRAVLPAGPPQGAAPALGTGREAQAPVRRRRASRCRRRSPTTTPPARTRRVRATDADRRRPDRRATSNEAVPQGLSRTRTERDDGSTSATCKDYLACVASVDDNVGRLLDCLGPRRPRDDTSSSTPPTRASSSATTAGSTSGSCTRSRSGCRSSCRYPRAVAAGQALDRHRHQRRLRRRPCSSAAGSTRRPAGCRAAASGPTCAGERRRATGRDGHVLPLLEARRPQPPASGRTTASAPTGTSSSTSTTTGSACLAAPTSATRRSGSSTTCERDPAELRNVADDPAYADVRRQLEAKMAEYQRHYRDEPYVGPDTPHLCRDRTTKPSSSACRST